MSNVLRKIARSKGPGIPGRTFERTQGCWSCIHFENGEKSRLYWINTARPRDAAYIAQQQFAGKVTNERAAEMIQMADAQERAINQGKVGLCLAGKVQSEYVSNKYLCDHWTGAQGASVARAGEKADLLPQEIKEIIDGPEGPPIVKVDDAGDVKPE